MKGVTAVNANILVYCGVLVACSSYFNLVSTARLARQGASAHQQSTDNIINTEAEITSTPKELYYHKAWAALPSAVRVAYAALGYDELTWNKEGTVVTDGLHWGELSREQRDAAVRIGYTQELWDGVGMPSKLSQATSTPAELYYKKVWAALPLEVQADYTVLGYDESTWNKEGVALTDGLRWSELSQEKRDAAIRIGYTQELWDTTAMSVPTDVNNGEKNGQIGFGLDFAVVGFPKTGTTTLLRALEKHPQISMPPQEFCQIHLPDGDRAASQWIQNASLSATNADTLVPKKYGIKCPTMLRQTNAIDNLVKMNVPTKLIIGVRNPVHWFESLYNFRLHDHLKGRGMSSRIPSPNELNRKFDWQDVTPAYAKFEIFLQQLAKVPLSQDELSALILNDELWPKRISPNPFKVFMFSTEQLKGNNTDQFRHDLQQFLELETPIMDFNLLSAHESNMHHDEYLSYPEHLDICEERFRDIRSELHQSAKKTSHWIIDRFIKSQDVVVSSRRFFEASLRSWKNNPCDENDDNGYYEVE